MIKEVETEVTAVENLQQLSKEACSIPKGTKGDEAYYSWEQRKQEN